MLVPDRLQFLISKISCVVTVAVFAYADCWFSNATDQMILTNDKENNKEECCQSVISVRR